MDNKLANAEIEFKEGNYKNALDLYNQITETEHFSLHIKQQKANCLFMLHEYEQSKNINAEIIKLYPENAIGYANYALNLYSEGKGIEGIAFLEKHRDKVNFTNDHLEIMKDAILQIESKLIFGEASESSKQEIGTITRIHIIDLKNLIGVKGFPIEDFQFNFWPRQSDEISRLNITYKNDQDCRFTFTTMDSTLFYSPTPESFGPPFYTQFFSVNFETLKDHFNKWICSIYF